GGGSAMRVTLPLEQPKGYEDPSGKQYTYAILLDEETGDLRATEVTLTADDPYVTTWPRSQRTTSLRVPA
ncbi:MAG: hypothetical protein JWM98_3066, partial [Thermoleophilia bacterium]|nr:hypothetical protein [Thermoleophilia bacterium]